MFVGSNKQTHIMSKILKSTEAGRYTVQVRSTSHPVGARPEYSIEVYYLRDNFGMEPYQAQVGYHPETIKTKAQALNVCDAIANGRANYKGFMCGELSTIPQ